VDDSAIINPLGIESGKELAFRLGLPLEMLKTEAGFAGQYYRPFIKRQKPAPFAKLNVANRERVIENPTGSLKEIQKRINERLLRPIVFPNHIYGGVRGRNALDIIEKHISADVVVRLDIKKFFPSISNVQVFDIWNKFMGCSPEVAGILTKLTTFDGDCRKARLQVVLSLISSSFLTILKSAHFATSTAFCTQHGLMT
jgi:hypothetical protein